MHRRLLGLVSQVAVRTLAHLEVPLDLVEFLFDELPVICLVKQFKVLVSELLYHFERAVDYLVVLVLQ